MLARYREGHGKPWRAAVKHRYHEYYLGSYATQDEAETVEREFRVRVFGTEEPVRKHINERVGNQ